LDVQKFGGILLHEARQVKHQNFGGVPYPQAGVGELRLVLNGDPTGRPARRRILDLFRGDLVDAQVGPGLVDQHHVGPELTHAHRHLLEPDLESVGRQGGVAADLDAWVADAHFHVHGLAQGRHDLAGEPLLLALLALDGRVELLGDLHGQRDGEREHGVGLFLGGQRAGGPVLARPRGRLARLGRQLLDGGPSRHLLRLVQAIGHAARDTGQYEEGDEW